jgi:glucosamine-6-phosphate deaminase
MNALWPEYLRVSAEDLGSGTSVSVRRVGDADDLARTMAEDMFQAVAAARGEGRRPTLIIPVGPVDQFPLLAEQINRRGESWDDVMLINMDEYLTDDDDWVPLEHPLSFRGYMKRKFYDLLDPALAPAAENRIFPDPHDCAAVARQIAARGGVDACFGGIGINGHIAFNEPPEPGQTMSVVEFAALPTRVLSLSRETRTINSVTVGGELAAIPRRAVTVGMRELLAARGLCFYCNRPWQRGVVRRALHGPVTAACPASLLRTHPHVEVTVANYVAEVPDIGLR